jgi:TPR repeat protein
MGNATGMWSIGILYEKGKGFPKDYSEAMKWYKKAADLGLTEAMKAIGDLYKEGKGVPKDLAEAEKWYKMARDEDGKVKWTFYRTVE